MRRQGEKMKNAEKRFDKKGRSCSGGKSGTPLGSKRDDTLVGPGRTP